MGKLLRVVVLLVKRASKNHHTGGESQKYDKVDGIHTVSDHQFSIFNGQCGQRLTDSLTLRLIKFIER